MSEACRLARSDLTWIGFEPGPGHDLGAVLAHGRAWDFFGSASKGPCFAGLRFGTLELSMD